MIPVNDKYIDKIVFQQQPTGTSCVHTCLSMLTGIPVEKIIEEMGPEGQTFIAETNFLLRHGYFPVRLMNDPIIGWGFPRTGLYLLTVASLNTVGAQHRILVEVDNNYNEIVYDPNEGKEGKKFYKDSDGMIGFNIIDIFYLDKNPALFKGLFREA